MSTRSAVATGVIGDVASETKDFTVSGFGTVDAAIVIVTNANSTNNPQASSQFSIGFWDGINSAQHCVSFGSLSGEASVSATGRSHLTNAVVNLYEEATPAVIVDATASAITDGIRLTIGTDNTGAERYCTVILISGVVDVHLATHNLGTGTSALDVTAPGFKPDIVFFSSVGVGATTSGQSAGTIGFGAAHNSSTDTITQAAIYCDSEDASATSDTHSYATHSYCCGNTYNGTVNWQISASDFDSSGFSITPTASAGGDIVSYLAIKLADPDDAWIDIIDAATATGDDAHTGVGFRPQSLALVSSAATSLDTVTAGQVFGFGAADRYSEQGMCTHDEDGQSTTDSASEIDLAKALLILNADGTTNAEATLTSFDSDGFTLNYSDAATGANKILAFAVGSAATFGYKDWYYSSRSYKGTDRFNVNLKR